MNLADRYNFMNINEILEEGHIDENPRPKLADGTPAHTLFVNHNFRSYDLNEGEFPITSLRPIAWKTGIKEILAIYQRQSNRLEDFEKMGITWWEDWRLEDGTIGKAYPYNLESHRPDEMKRLIMKIPRKVFDTSVGQPHPVKQFEYQRPDYETIYFDRYQVLGKDYTTTDKKHHYYTIQFLSNNYKTSIRQDTIGKNKGANPYDRTVYGIGYLGEYDKHIANFTKEEISKLKIKWDSMMERGYSQNFKQKHPIYQDIFVHYDWHCFEHFLRDVRYLPQFALAREEGFVGWDLDKDYYGSNCYSKDTCVFLKCNENSLYAQSKGVYKIEDLNTHQVCYEINLSDFARKIDTTQQVLQKAVEKTMRYKNFTFEFIKNDDNFVYRYELSRNQLNELLKDLQENPYGRRHIMSFWNWANIDKKSLVECAYETIWNVRPDEENDGLFLDMVLIQRSGDYFMASGAGGINEVQYAALLMMVAKHCGYKPGRFSHFVANEHIYTNLIPLTEEMLKRYDALRSIPGWKNEPEPWLNFHPMNNNFYDFTIDDFTMENYNPVKPQLKGEIAV